MNLSHVRKKYQFRYIPVLSPQLRRTLRVLYICIERFDLLGVKNRKEQSLRNKVMMSYAYSLPAIFQVWECGVVFTIFSYLHTGRQALQCLSHNGKVVPATGAVTLKAHPTRPPWSEAVACMTRTCKDLSTKRPCMRMH